MENGWYSQLRKQKGVELFHFVVRLAICEDKTFTEIFFTPPLRSIGIQFTKYTGLNKNKTAAAKKNNIGRKSNKNGRN